MEMMETNIDLINKQKQSLKEQETELVTKEKLLREEIRQLQVNFLFYIL